MAFAVSAQRNARTSPSSGERASPLVSSCYKVVTGLSRPGNYAVMYAIVYYLQGVNMSSITLQHVYAFLKNIQVMENSLVHITQMGPLDFYIEQLNKLEALPVHNVMDIAFNRFPHGWIATSDTGGQEYFGVGAYPMTYRLTFSVVSEGEYRAQLTGVLSGTSRIDLAKVYSKMCQNEAFGDVTTLLRSISGQLNVHVQLAEAVDILHRTHLNQLPVLDSAMKRSTYMFINNDTQVADMLNINPLRIS